MDEVPPTSPSRQTHIMSVFTYNRRKITLEYSPYIETEVLPNSEAKYNC